MRIARLLAMAIDMVGLLEGTSQVEVGGSGVLE